MERDDKSLLAAVAAGDRSAFETIYHAHRDCLFRAALTLLGCDAAVEDVLHDVFVSLARRAGKIELRGTLRNYLITSCLNGARDVLRRRKREQVSAINHVLDDFEGTDPMASLEDIEQSRRLMRALSALSDEQRETVTLHIYGELKFREIAEMQGISINTAQSRYRYALSELRNILAEEVMKGKES